MKLFKNCVLGYITTQLFCPPSYFSLHLLPTILLGTLFCPAQISLATLAVYFTYNKEGRGRRGAKMFNIYIQITSFEFNVPDSVIPRLSKIQVTKFNFLRSIPSVSKDSIRSSSSIKDWTSSWRVRIPWVVNSTSCSRTLLERLV